MVIKLVWDKWNEMMQWWNNRHHGIDCIFTHWNNEKWNRMKNMSIVQIMNSYMVRWQMLDGRIFVELKAQNFFWFICWK
jgi:hypothetical protein